MLLETCLSILDGILSPKANDLSSGDFQRKMGKKSKKSPVFEIFRKIQNFIEFYISFYGTFDSAIGMESVLKHPKSRLGTFIRL